MTERRRATSSRTSWIIIVVVIIVGLALWVLLAGGMRNALKSQLPAKSKKAAAAKAEPARPGTPEPDALPGWLVQSGAPDRRVAGKVTAAGVPVSGAEVRLHVPALGQDAEHLTTRTGTDGSFDFGPQRPTQVVIAASAPGRAPAVESLDLASPGLRPRPDQLELRLGGCDGATFGVVRDASGGPIAAATLRLNGVIGVASGPEGNYEMCLDRGGGQVRVDAAGYASVLLFFSGMGRERRDVVLIPEAVIEGKVVRADDGRPVPGARVWCFPFEPGRERPAPRTAFADEAGAFRLTGLHFGRYRVGATSDGLGMIDMMQVAVTAGQTSGGHLLKLVPQLTVTGVIERRGQPISGATVQILGRSPVSYSGTASSQPDGSFVVTGANPGPSLVRVQGYRVLAPGQLVVGADGARDVRVEVAPLAAVRGRVLRGGKPVADALVQTRMAQVRSESDGRYELLGLEAGEAMIMAQSEKVGAFTEGVRVDLAEGEQLTLDLELESGGVIAGDVVDQSGKALAGVRVFWQYGKTGDQGTCLTDQEGRYQCDTMTGGGEYRPQVFPSSDASAALPWAGPPPGPVALADGNARADGIRLSVMNERKSIEGRVVDAAGEPIADARVHALSTRPGAEPVFSSWLALPQTRTDVEGGFALQGLAPGTYALRAQAPDGGDGVLRDVVAGAKGVFLTVVRPGGLRGKLVGYRTTPPVYLQALDGTRKFFPATVEGDSFRADNIAAGKYVVSAMNLEEGDAEAIEVRSGAPTDVVMESKGSGTIEGTVVEQGTGAPVPGFRCHTVLRAGGWRGITNWNPDSLPVTNAQGRFVLNPAPAGDVNISCFGTNQMSSPSVSATLTRGGKLTVRMQAVRETKNGGGTIGLVVDPQQDDNRVHRVDPGSPAARAEIQEGDYVVSIAGVPTAEIGPNGIISLIHNHAPGQKVTLVVARGMATRTLTLTAVEREN